MFEDIAPRGWRLASLILAIILVVGVTVFFLLGVSLRFSVHDELHLILSPLSAHVVSTGQPATLNFTLENDNFAECRARCTFRMVDLNRTVAEQQAVLDHGDKHLVSFGLPAPETPGKKIYSFEVRCRNVKTVVCRTDGRPRHKSALVVVERKFDDRERAQREHSRQQLEAFLRDYATLQKLTRENDILTSRLPLSFERADVLEFHEQSKRPQDPQRYIERYLAYESVMPPELNLSVARWVHNRSHELLQLHNDNVEFARRIPLIAARILNSSLPLNVSLEHQTRRLLRSARSDIELLHKKTPEEALHTRLQEHVDALGELENITVQFRTALAETFNAITCPHANLTNTSLCQNRSFDWNYSFTKVNTTFPDVEVTPLQVPDLPPQCCAFNECRSCLTSYTPVLFIHGHAFNEQNTPEYSMSSFTKLQERLQEQGYLNAGELSLMEPTNWTNLGFPLTTRASYYFIDTYSLAGRTVTTQKSERIENYALRLKEIVDTLQRRTGAEQIVVVAHSMGGLVLREYMHLFGADVMEKVIFVNSPHHGISPQIERYCRLIGATKECEDMSNNSVFLSRLNARPLPDVEIHNIRSIGCVMDDTTGDGIVTNESAHLEGAQNYVLTGNCTDPLNAELHTNILDPDFHPEFYKLLVELL